MNKASLYVLMATFNGGVYLRQQLDSICVQYGDWCLVVRDDGSSDLTMEILSDYKNLHSNILVMRDEYGNQGACGNFNRLLMEAVQMPSCQYVALSDQDDVWDPEKINKQLSLMKEMEKKYPGQAILIHSDLSVVDHCLDTISPSMMQYQGIQHERSKPLNVLLAQNFVTGCTVLLNRPLIEFALPLPDDVLMHDWWLALCAAVFGHIAYIDEPLVKYRQHDNNGVGAQHMADFMNPLSGRWMRRWENGRINLFQSMKQAQALAERMKKCEPDNPHLALVESYAALRFLSPLKRVASIYRLGVHFQSKLRQALLISRLLWGGGWKNSLK